MNFFFKESKSKTKKKNFGGVGVGGERGARGSEFFHKESKSKTKKISFYYESKFKIFFFWVGWGGGGERGGERGLEYWSM